MSAYAHLQGMFDDVPITMETTNQRIQAVPPFADREPAPSEGTQQASPQSSQSIPIHVPGGEPDLLMLAMGVANCPIQEGYRDTGMKFANTDLLEQYEPLLADYKKSEIVPNHENLVLTDLEPYIDIYQVIDFERDGADQPVELSQEGQELAGPYRAMIFYDVLFHDDEAARIASSEFLQLVHDKLEDRKQDEDREAEDQTSLRYVYLSGHDTTVTAFMSGIEHKDGKQPPYASQILIEMFERDGKNYVTWSWNGELINLESQGVECNEEKECSLDSFLNYIDSRTVGNIEEACEAPSSFPTWAIVLLVLLGVALIAVGIFISVWLIRRKRKEAVYRQQLNETESALQSAGELAPNMT